LKSSLYFDSFLLINKFFQVLALNFFQQVYLLEDQVFEVENYSCEYTEPNQGLQAAVKVKLVFLGVKLALVIISEL
jgi:hypothetical protein